jgi:hypothetical protein
LEGLPAQANGEPHFIVVKRELSYGEEQALYGAMIGGVKASGKKGEADAEMGVDMKAFALKRFRTWIVSWSLTRKRGALAEIVPVSADAIANLRGPVAEAIDKALDAHVEVLSEAKKGTTGA